MATAYEQATRKQWTQPIGFVHALFEVAVDVLKRSAEKNDPKAVVAAIAATKLDTVVAHIEGNGKELPPFARKNIAKTPLVGSQWRPPRGPEEEVASN